MISNNLRPRLPRCSHATTATTERVYKFGTQELRKRMLATEGTRDTPKE